MKLIRCKNCDDVVRLVHTKWRKCDCGKSGGQYNDELLSATVGGDCEVIGIRNDFFSAKPFSKERSKVDDKGARNNIIQGEYEGDVQIHRIESADGPKLKMKTEKIDDDTLKVTFTDDRKYTINLKGNKSPKTIELPANDSPSFKDKKKINENIEYLKKLVNKKMSKNK
jgi:hypothetical protein